MLDRVPVTDGDQVGQRPDGVLSDGDDPASQRTLMVGLFEQAVPHHPDDVRSASRDAACGRWWKAFFEERGRQYLPLIGG